MPKVVSNYSNGLIYKLCCRDPMIDDIYIGSTTNMTQRKARHKCNCNNANSKAYNFNVYRFIRANGGWDNWDMVMIEQYECETKQELHTRERYYIDQLKPTLNKNIPLRTGKEYSKQYYNENKTAIRNQVKQYAIKNKEKIAVWNKQYRVENKEKIIDQHKQYYNENKEKIIDQHKQYYNENKPVILEKKKQYRVKNKEKIAASKSQSFMCCCGHKYAFNHRSRHLKTPVHNKLATNPFINMTI